MTKDRRGSLNEILEFDECDQENDQRSINFERNCRRNNYMAGRPFKFVKFRTMYVDAPQRFPELYEYKFSEKEKDFCGEKF